jgi:2-polyprenyl-3-methyl-5-hydroxy-6-metoxy-1,4-benzoquinol methylase
MSLNRILGIPIEKVLDRFSEDMKSNLRKACRTFSSRKGRHMCSSELIYSSFDILHFSVSPEEAQRNSVMRLNDFGITSNSLRGKRVLDLGSNIGSMLFAIQKYKPAYCLGIEYDADKVLVAEQIAAYSGLNNIKFVQADIDTIDIPQVVGPFDIVLCLSVEAHLKKPRRLFRYLSQATTEILYYEGNSTTDVRKTRKALLDSGFHKVTFVGKSRDDIVPNNNCRPLLVALK